jgi:hypothetical protein
MDQNRFVGFEVFTAMIMKNAVCHVGLVKIDVSEEIIASTFRVEKFESEEKRWQLANILLTLFFVRRRWRRQAPPKRRFLKDPNSATSHKTAFPRANLFSALLDVIIFIRFKFVKQQE